MTTTSPTKSIRVLSTLRSIAGSKEVSVPAPTEMTVGAVLHALRETHPALAARVLTADGAITPGIQCLVNGRHIDWLQGLETPVTLDDDLLLIPPVSGG
ncbi:MAG: MoaD/ThiS family protein [Chloroflexi bacterium]|nr:MoaD/ThiS family protein [Chloroflexota bacterium]